MLFPTIEFAIFFAISFALVWLFNEHNTFKKIVLLGLSLIFYASWNPKFLLLLFGIGIITYATGLYVDPKRGCPFRMLALAGAITADLSILVYFKYLNFFIAQFHNLTRAVGAHYDLNFVNVTLPIAISFMTFHSISYVVDVYNRRLESSRAPLDVLLYISFFPHLVAGPIVRAHDFLPQLASPRNARDFSLDENCLLILGGLFKKMVVANYLAVKIVDPVFTDPSQFSRWDLIVATYAYAIQIYADFSAYTDIAIGVAALLGYRFPQNFNQPYRAVGVGDFWRRWHMTLSSWLRDYLYIPLGGNRHGMLDTVRNLMLTMVLGGLWHGANWTFLAWGTLHGAALVVDHAWRHSAAFDRFGSNPVMQAFGWAATFNFVCFAWIFFRAPSVDMATQFLAGIWTDNGAPNTASWVVLPLIVCGALTQILPAQLRIAIGRKLDHHGSGFRIAANFALLYGILVMAPSSSAPFIYFQF